MRLLIQYFFFIFLLNTINSKGFAQDINFSQFYEMPLLRNPALAGIYGADVRTVASYRNQWASVSRPFNTQALSFEFKGGISSNSDDYVTGGFLLTNDRAGDSKLGQTQLLPMVAYHKSLSAENDMFLTLAFMGGPVRYSLETSDLRFTSNFITNFSGVPDNLVTQFSYLDASAGISFSATTSSDLYYYLGGALFHITQPSVSLLQLNDAQLARKYSVNAGVSLPIIDFNRLIFYFDAFSQNKNNLYQAGVLYKNVFEQTGEDEYLSMTIGCILRWNDAIIPVVKFDYYKLSLGLSYDTNISKLRGASQFRGGIEATFNYKTYLNVNGSAKNKLRCLPKF
jgi:type IX secretion system PorP/SprF family membrane protein